MMAPQSSSCPLISKMPQRKKSSDAFEDRKLLKEHNAFVEILQMAWENPSSRLSFLADMKLELTSDADQGKNMPDTMFHVHPPTFGHVCIEWIAGFLSEVYPLLTDGVLGLIRVYDTCNLRNMACNALHCSLTWKLPPSCQDKRVLRDLLKHRLAVLGQVRMVITEDIITEIVGLKGHVNWGRIGPFAIDYQGDKTARAYHRPTDSYAPIDADLQVKVGSGWDLDKNWSDSKCTLEKGPARKHNMIDFWTKNSKPRLTPAWSATVKGMDVLCDKFAQVYQQKEEELHAAPVKVAGDDFATPTKLANSERMKTARVSATASQQDRAQKRRCLLADAVGTHTEIQAKAKAIVVASVL